MKTSLSTRVFVVYAAVVLLYSLSVYFIIQRYYSAFNDILFAHQKLSLVNEELRLLITNLDQLSIQSSEQTNDPKDIVKFYSRLSVEKKIRRAALTISKIKQRYSWSKKIKMITESILARFEKELSQSTLIEEARKNPKITALFTHQLPDTDLNYLRSIAQKLTKTSDLNSIKILYTQLKKGIMWLDKDLHTLLNGTEALDRIVYDELNQQITTTWKIGLLFTGTSVIVSIVMMLLILLWLKPVEHLVGMVRAIAAGNYSIKLGRFGIREFDTLGEAIAALATSLKERDEKINHQQKQMVASERLATVGKMASVMAHEIRNPLNSLSLNLDILQESLGTLANNKEIQEQLRVIEGELNRLAAITESYLKFGRMPEGVLVDTDPQEVMQGLLEFMQEELKEKRIRLVFHRLNQTVKIKADPQRLRQAFMNLVRNAIEAMPEGGELRINFEKLDKKVKIIMEDTGPGIPQEIMDEIFEPFASTKPSGTGLGLAFVHQVVRECKGDIIVENQPKAGARFVMSFPLAKEE